MENKPALPVNPETKARLLSLADTYSLYNIIIIIKQKHIYSQLELYRGKKRGTN